MDILLNKNIQYNLKCIYWTRHNTVAEEEDRNKLKNKRKEKGRGKLGRVHYLNCCF